MTPKPWYRDGTAIGYALLALLLVVAGLHAGGACLDILASVSNPSEQDYGEGIVWQQALLMPGPRMYSASTDLPFVVFHYPPLYYVLVHAMRLVIPDYLAAGRAVTGIATVALAPLVAGLVLAASGRGAWRDRSALLVAVLAGLVVLAIHPVRLWGLLMRVDMVGIALGFAGMLVAAHAGGRVLGAVAALFLCTAAVFTKQTLVAPGIAVFLVLFSQRRWPAVAAATVVAIVGICIVMLLQIQTSGGFLKNIVGYNINRFSLLHGLHILNIVRQSSIIAILFVAAIVFQLYTLRRDRSSTLHQSSKTQDDVARRCRLIILMHFGISLLGLVAIFKAGSSYNYMTEILVSGSVLIGIAGVDLLRGGYQKSWSVAMVVLAVAVATGPLRRPQAQAQTAAIAQEAEIVRVIRHARRPVGSDNMTLLMRAGKPVFYEPAIVTELALLGLWDERPLVEMIRSHGFAFMLTDDLEASPEDHYTPAVTAAMAEAYPNVIVLSNGLRMRLEDTLAPGR